MIKNIVSFLPPALHRQLRLMLLVMTVSGIIESISVVSIAPFLILVSDPSLIHSHSIVHKVFTILNFSNDSSFIVFVGISFIAVNILTNSIKLLILLANSKFIWKAVKVIATNLQIQYLTQPYTFFLKRNSADLLRNIHGEVTVVVQGYINSILVATERITVVILLALLVIIQSPVIALSMCACFGIFYVSIYGLLRTKMNFYAVESKLADERRFKLLKESFDSFKLLKLYHLESFFHKTYDSETKLSTSMQAKNNVVAASPRLLLEPMAMSTIIILTLYLFFNTKDFASVIPSLGLYAFAFYKLLPSTQILFSQFAKVKFLKPRFLNLVAEIQNTKKLPSIPNTSTELVLGKKQNPLIQIEDLQFKYPNTKNPVLKIINLKIDRFECIGILGQTGSGKTTLLDIILGLLKPTSGKLLINNIHLKDSNMHEWQSAIGYVPQDVILLDDSIEANITLGATDETIDKKLLLKVAKASKIHNFITKEMPNGYDTKVGERGVRLSGGQKQRIGIARALYRKPQILVFDEATSNLDGKTENELMDSINELHGELTILMVAHRINTLRHCDKVILLHNGKIIKNGCFNEVTSNIELHNQ